MPSERLRKAGLLLTAAIPLLLVGCSDTLDPSSATSKPPEIFAQRPDFAGDDTREDCRDFNPNNNAYFGALHVHTSLSFDSWVFSNSNGPEDAYRYAKGESIVSGPANDPENPQVTLQLDRPLDFAAVTDHAESFAQISVCTDPKDPNYNNDVCLTMRGERWWADVLPDSMARLGRVFSMGGFGPMAVDDSDVCGDDKTCTAASLPVWLRTQKAAEAAYDRSSECSFSAIVGFEYSLSTKDTGNNMHRNVLFRNATVLNLPVASNLAKRPEQLWEYLDDACNSADNDCEVLAIPHNTNFSAGESYAPVYGGAKTLEEEKKIAALRIKTEPLFEIYQLKGDSECRNGMYGVGGAPDEFCDFEKIHPPKAEVEDCMDESGDKGLALTGCVSRRNFARYNLTEGLKEKERLGVNPFEFGIIAATDTHSSDGGNVDEQDVSSGLVMTNTPEKRLKGEVKLPGGVATLRQARFSPGGLAGIYAPQNTREDLFDAMRKREAFGTSGPRIQPRFFAGENLTADMCNDPEMISKAYKQGVPMGSNMSLPADSKNPTFLVSALADAGSANVPGVALQRIQIIKGWVDDKGTLQQKVYDVAGNPNNGASVDVNTCEPQGTGFQQLCAAWQDPEFDKEQSAVYYARVLENPSCRWSTYECNRLPEGDRPETCDNPAYPKTIQERAWTSPIWYYPEAKKS